MPALIGLPDQRQRRRDPVGRAVIVLPSSRGSQSHHATASGKVTLSCVLMVAAAVIAPTLGLLPFTV